MSGVYAIYDRGGLADDARDRVTAVLAAGVDWLQYRDKRAQAPDRALLHGLRTATRDAGARLIINDDWQLARDVDADGVHLGEDDPDVARARWALGPEAIIGASCSGSLARAEAAVDAGASYVSFGRFFESATKPDAAAARLSILAEARRLRVPIIAIGGINADNAARVFAAGADRIAVAGGLFNASDSGAAAATLVRLSREAQAS